jgi:hypothetical protein
MSTLLRAAPRGTILSVLLLVAALLLPGSANAIQLRWATGATDLTVSANMQAVLVVQADSSEGTLPNTWQLLWTTDSLAVHFSAFDPSSACLVDTAWLIPRLCRLPRPMPRGVCRSPLAGATRTA